MRDRRRGAGEYGDFGMVAIMSDALIGVIWKLLAIVACAAILGTSSCVMYESYLVKEAIISGADPIKTRCAFTGSDEYKRTICVLQSSKP